MGTHRIQYEVLNSHNEAETGRIWDFEVHATVEELQAFEKRGYLIRENLFAGKALSALRDALERLEEREAEKRDRAMEGKKSWGFIPRYLMDKDEVFLSLLKFEPTLSIARAMMGPLIRLRGLSARISYPGNGRLHQTTWHQHLRVISNPLPPWFSRPHCIDTLIYPILWTYFDKKVPFPHFGIFNDQIKETNTEANGTWTWQKRYSMSGQSPNRNENSF